MLSIYVYTNSPWESITIRRSVSLHFNWWISHRLKQEEVKSQHVCSGFLKTLYLKILWIQIIPFLSGACSILFYQPYNMVSEMYWAKKHQDKQWFLYASRRCALYARAPEAAGQWHALVAVMLTASWRLPEPDSMPRLILHRRHYEEDRNNPNTWAYLPARWSSVTETLPSHAGIWGTW